MKVNLLKKELVVGTIFLLLLATIPHIASNDLPSDTAYTDDLVVAVTTDKNKYNIGEPVEVTINVTNNGYEDVTLVFPNTQLADFSVDDYLYLWSYDRFFAAMITPITVPSGETVILLNDFWNQVDISGNQVPKGVYHIDGWMVEGIGHPEIHGDPVIITIGEYSPKPEFEIDYRPWYFGKLWFDIKNVGDMDAINVNWSIAIDIYIIMIVPPIIPLPYWNGTIPILPVNESERISSDGFIFGLGFPKIIITLNATNAEEVTSITRGLFLGPFIWLPKCL